MTRTPIRLAAAAALVALIAGCEAPQPLGPAGSVADFISRVSTADGSVQAVLREATTWATCRDAGERSKDEVGASVQEQRLVELSAVEEQRAPWLGETPWGSSARGFGGRVWYHGRRRAGEAE